MQHPGPPPETADPSRKPPTILVVEDDRDTRDALAELLEERGYTAIVAEDGEQASHYLATHPIPACVVLDLCMPVRNGWSLATDVLHSRLPHVPVVVVTASPPYVGYPVLSRFVLRKPINPDRLLMLVAELLKTRAPFE
jgi:two-component system, chemotaxis family, chemotaxis protein CheY